MFRLKPLAAAIIGLFSVPVYAQDAAIKFCKVNGKNSCDFPVSVDASKRGILSIRAVGPVTASSGTLVIENVNTGKKATVELRRSSQAFNTVAQMKGSEPAPPNQWAPGYEATIFTSALEPGSYRVVSYSIGSGESVPLDVSSGARFDVVGSNGDVGGIELLDSSGSPIQRLAVIPKSNQFLVTGYPSLENGQYKIRASIGGFSDTKTFNLNRPSREVNVSMPFVEGLPGINTRLILRDILQNIGLEGNITLKNKSAHTIVVNGQQIAQGQSFGVGFAKGLGFITLANEASGSASSVTVDLFNESPDGEHLKMNISKWVVDNFIEVKPKNPSSAVKVEKNTVEATLSREGRDHCFGPGVFFGQSLSQTENIVCAIEWKDRAGLKFNGVNRNQLIGELPNIGDNNIVYRTGVIYTDPVSKKTAFYPSALGDKTLKVTGTEPPLPKIEFLADSKYRYLNEKLQFGPDKTLVSVVPSSSNFGALAGIALVKAPFRGLHVKITPQGEESSEYITSLNNVGRPVSAKLIASLESKPVSIEAWYEKAPEYKTTKTIETVGAVLNVVALMDRGILSHTEADTIITGKMGSAVGPRIEYDKNVLNGWKVLVEVDGLGQRQVDVDENGNFSVNLGRLSKGTRRVKIMPQVVGDGSISLDGARANFYQIETHDGRAPVASIKVKKESGPAPFTTSMNLDYADPGFSKVASVEWEKSSDGQNWETLKNDRGVPFNGYSAAIRLENPEEIYIRAKTTNKYSGLSAVTEPVTLQGFEVGGIEVTGPANVAVGSRATFTVVADGFGSNPVCDWQISDGLQDVVINGNEISFTSMKDGSFGLAVSVRAEKANPDNKESWRTKRFGVRFVNPLLASPTISGPTKNVEVGKTYRFEAVINDVLPKNVARNYELEGGFVMPDGTVVPGTSADITIQPDQKVVQYATWVKGLEQMRKVTSYSIYPWMYVWPNWRVDLRTLSKYAPAQVRYQIQASLPLNTLRGEPLEVIWNLPSNVSLSAENDFYGVLTFNDPGTYSGISALVKDSRGNVTEIELPTIVVANPSEIEAQVDVISPYKEAMVAPGTYTVRYTITKLPQNDRFQVNELYVNDVKVGEFYGTYANVQIGEPGTYTIAVKTLTKNGNEGVFEKTIELAEPPAPTCTVSRSRNSIGETITPTCNISVGVVTGYRWSWIQAGENKSIAGRSLYVSKKDFGTVSNIQLTVSTSVGGKLYTFDIAPPDPNLPEPNK